MKLLAVRLARSIWFIPQYFLNPKGLFLRPAVAALKERYQFLKSPFDNSTVGTNEPKYEQGSFKSSTGTIRIMSMVLHGDGIVVDTRSSTADADAFLEDVSTWMNKEYGLPLYVDLPIRRAYVSELNVVLEKSPTFFNPRLNSFFGDVASSIGGEGERTGFLSWQYSTDPTVSPHQKIFRIDREVNTSFEDKRYYAFAPLQTDVHLGLLEKMEAAL